MTISMSEVSSGIERHSHNALGDKQFSNLFIFVIGQFIDCFFVELFDGWRLDALAKNGPEGDQVGVGTRMRLYVGMVASKQLADLLLCEAFDGIDIVAACIETMVSIAFCIFVSE